MESCFPSPNALPKLAVSFPQFGVEIFDCAFLGGVGRANHTLISTNPDQAVNIHIRPTQNQSGGRTSVKVFLNRPVKLPFSANP